MDGEVADALFRDALAAIDAEDVGALERLLRDHPSLAHVRLERPGAWLVDQIGPAIEGFFKHPWLLWFLTEDAVRSGRIPANVGEFVRVIVRAARSDGADNLQEALDTTLHFAVCSPIGRDDGRQLDLIDALIQEGASLEGAPVQALICSNFAAARHLLARGAVLTLPVAVCLEHWADIARLGPGADAEEKQVALALAALNGKAQGLAQLIPLGVDVNAFSSGFYTHATPLHHAVWSGSLEAVRILVEAGARLDTKDRAYEATPLGWAEHALSSGAAAPGQEFAAIAAWLRARQG